MMGVALPLGGTLALTVMATVFNNVSGIGPNSPFRDFDTLSKVPEPFKSQIINQAKVSVSLSQDPGYNIDLLTNTTRNQMGVVWAFVAITPFMLLVCSVTIPWRA